MLDTHCWLWLQASPDRLCEDTLRVLENERNDLLLSAASSWEIAIKYALGKLSLPESPTSYVPSRMAQSGTSGLAVEHVHALGVVSLPAIHRDPFDRILVAQARCEGLTIVTADPNITQYDVPVLAP